MVRSRWKYIVAPRKFYERADIPSDSAVWKRFPQLLGLAWEETGAQYAHSSASNERLAELWGVSAEAARKTLAEMREYKLIETKQVGRTGRLIQILVAYRGQGQDSSPEINAPDTRESRLEAQPHASVAQTQPKFEDGNSTTSLADLPNVVVGTDVPDSSDSSTQQQHVLANSDCTAREDGNSATTLTENPPIDEAIFDLLDRIVIAEPSRTTCARLPHMTYEYLLPWAHYAEDHPKLGGGFFVLRFQKAELAPRAYQRNAVRRETERERESAARERQLAELTAPCPEVAYDAKPQNPYVQDHAGELWHAAKGELQLQLSKATFDAWLRGASALGWDGDQLVVGVSSPYAQEWLEARLSAKVRDTVAGIAGRDVQIRFEVRNA